MKSKLVRLWPVEDGEVIRQDHPNFGNYNWSNDKRLEALDRDYEISNDTERLWLENGFEVVADRFGDPYKLSEIKLDFTDAEWVDIFQTEGELLPSCCANISHVRDILISSLRNGGFISMTDLEEGTRLLAEHHDCDSDDPMTTRFINLWDSVKDHASCFKNIGQPKGVDPNDPKVACSIVHNLTASITYEMFWGKGFEHDVKMVSTLLKLTPAIGVLYNRIKELDPGVLEGFAVCKDGEIVETMRGLGLYDNEEFANQVATRFNEKYDGEYIVRPARISLDEGLILI